MVIFDLHSKNSILEGMDFTCIKWVPCLIDGGIQSLPLGDVVDRLGDIQDIQCCPLLRLAILRALLAIHDGVTVDGFIEGLLSPLELPDSSARSTADVLAMRDGNNAALSPFPAPSSSSDVEDARAIVLAYFCDRPGLKAKISGFPISGSCPLHMGKNVVFLAWENLQDFLEKNSIPGTGEYLMHRWRNLRLSTPGRLVIAAGAKYKGSIDMDPWSAGKAFPWQRGKPFQQEKLADEKKTGVFAQTLASVDAEIDLTGIALQQASPLAIWSERTKIQSKKKE